MEVVEPETEKEETSRSEGKLIKLKLSQIRSYKNNAKLHTTEQIGKIRDSILTFGYKDLIAVDENNVILEGHGRLQALYQIDSTGNKEISVMQITDLNDSEKKAYRIAHNKLNMDTGFDDSKLSKEFNDLEKTDNFNDTGFNVAEISEIWEKSEINSKYDAEIEFTQELLEEHNYLVLYFDNIMDWQVAKDKFNVKPKQALASREGFEKKGTGRVINGADVLGML